MSRTPKDNEGRRSPSDEEDEPVVIPAFDTSALIARFSLTLIGRTFHVGGRSTEALLAFMPRSDIWDVAGRVRGVDLGHGRFHFDFESEEDLQKVLKKRPCHFNKWTFALERWEPNIQEDFPNSVTFWITVRGIPLHLWVKDVFQRIGDSLGLVKAVDVKEGRISVSIDVTRPLKFKKKVQFNLTEKVTASLEYDRLYRFCGNCHMISHEEVTCPLLSDPARRRNRESRRTPLPGDNRRVHGLSSERAPARAKTRLEDRPSRSGGASSHREGSNRPVENPTSLPEAVTLVPSRGLPQRSETAGDRDPRLPRHREQSSQSSAGSRKRRPYESAASSAEVRREPHRSGGHRVFSNRQRKGDSVQRQRSPPCIDPSFEQWGNSRPPRHESGICIVELSSPPPPASRSLAPQDKGKGKAVAEDDEEDANSDIGDFESSPKLLEIGSASGDIHSPPFGEIIPALEVTPMDFPADKEPENDEVRSMFGNESVPTDWEDRVDATAEDTELTEEDMRILDECLMMTEGAMEEDDLLGEDLAAEEFAVSLEHTISDVVVPISHSPAVTPAISPSPTSKRVRSPDQSLARKNQRSSPHARHEKMQDKKKKIPRSPKVNAAVSKKLKPSIDIFNSCASGSQCPQGGDTKPRTCYHPKS
ncbi:uncharacterized protein LOC112086493 [Eutrema salsugineum]|uniref:uncharacterized protein LOC112086493 n=1 Tax=Eutrema salsugineum TaxID=72664 RepID=UPI000CED3864|nr:uncharacterized protein LOC112086493 [Eutrema salsugineum]